MSKNARLSRLLTTGYTLRVDDDAARRRSEGAETRRAHPEQWPIRRFRVGEEPSEPTFTGGPSTDENERRRRAAARREYPGEVVLAGAPKPPLYDRLTPAERFARMLELCSAQWQANGRDIVQLPRADWPGEIFRIRPSSGDGS